MLVYILVTEDGDPVMVYDDESLAHSQVDLVTASVFKNTGKVIKIKEIVTRKLNLPAMYSGLPKDHLI